MIGKKLAHYEVGPLLGKGGMGEVYRARDTRLGRDVALKVLPPELSGDPERVARFAREARTLASLQHPNVASIYGFEEAGGLRFLTMELVEGEDLSALFDRGPLPVEEALRVARQIAAGLEAAHQKGIVHRDLKPANVKLTPDGSVKVLDFGLARAYVGEGFEESSPEKSPTITAALTHAGVILGTAAYMSPEQARGRSTDNRADIWAFGVVLFEMISGQRLFSGETVSDTLASVLKTEVDWASLPSDLPPRVRTLLGRCLDRDRDRRLRDIGEARIVLEDELSGAPDTHLEAALRSGVLTPGATTMSPPPRRVPWPALAAGVALGAVLALGAARLLLAPAPAELPLRKLTLGLGDAEERHSDPVIAPDGHAIAFVIPGHIVVREMRALEVRRFPVGEPVKDLFWSPDGRSLAYIVQRRLYRIDAVSGQQQVVCEAKGQFEGGAGGSWSDVGTIVFTQSDVQGLFEVSERGGDPRQIAAIDPQREGDFHDPAALPGGRGVLFVPHLTTDAFSTLEVWSEGRRKPLVALDGQSLSEPVYSSTGHVLFHRAPVNEGIWAVPFSLERLEVTGEPFLVAPSATSPSVSRDGTLVYRSGSGTAAVRLTWNDPSGREVADAGEVSLSTGYTFPALAPGGTIACASVYDEENSDLWVFDAARGTRSRLTFGEGTEEWPVWTPSGDAVLYHIRARHSSAIDSMRVLRVAADGTARPDTLAVGFVPAVSPDGRFVVFSKVSESGGWGRADLAYRSLTEERAPVVELKAATGLQMDGRVAPGGAYVAYVSDESGRFEIYLTRFPSGEGRWQVSVDGGTWPRWNERGDRLYYASGSDLMVVDVTLGDSPRLGAPTLLLTRPELSVPTVAGWTPGFDVSGDGERLLYFRDPKTGTSENQIVVVQNWLAEFGTRP